MAPTLKGKAKKKLTKSQRYLRAAAKRHAAILKRLAKR